VDIAQLIGEYGFPIVATVGLLYMIYFIWQFITNEIKSKLGETIVTLIELIDRVRMLDNDIIRLNTKLSMVLENEAKLDKKRRAELEEIVSKYTDITNDPFNTTGTKD